MKRPISSRPLLVLAALLVLATGALPARAQLTLPGAVAPTPEGATVAPDKRPAASSATPPAKRKPRAPGEPSAVRQAAPVLSPAPATLAGQTLYLNGRRSQITFAPHDKGLQVSRLTLTGGKPSNPGEPCQVDMPAPPVDVTDLGRPAGLSRIKLAFPACPIVFDVLDGAVLAVGDPPSCDFPEKACRVSPAGLWGPQAGTLGPKEVKTVERARAQAETAARTNFKLLLTTTKDRPTISGYAREQAGFSSAREEICRDYAGEGRHGYCATRLTQARAAALKAKYDVEAAQKALRKKKHAGG